MFAYLLGHFAKQLLVQAQSEVIFNENAINICQYYSFQATMKPFVNEYIVTEWPFQQFYWKSDAVIFKTI